MFFREGNNACSDYHRTGAGASRRALGALSPSAAAAAPAPDSFWPQLTEAVRTSLKNPYRGYFSVTGPISCRLNGDTVVLTTDVFTLGMINAPEVLKVVGDKAAAILGRPVQVRAEEAGQKTVQNEAFERFAAHVQDLDGGDGVVQFT